MAPGVPASTPPAFLPEGPFLDLLAVSLTGVNVLQPVYDATSEVVDFAIEYLNPAGQRMTGLAERPGGTLLTRFPHAIAAGILAYYRRVYEAGATDVYEVNYQADTLDNYFRLAARRSGDRLVVSFTDTADQDRSAVEEALRESQAAEQAARAETETQRQRLFHILENFPAVVASYRGPEHVFELVSHQFQQDFPTRTIKGLPVREALPELEGQGYYDILAGVYRTGEPFYGTEIETWVDLTNTGKLELQYYNVCFQATRDAQGRIDGVLNFAYDVTDAVLARQQVQQLNQALEARVQVRTQELVQAQAETEVQRQRLHQLVAEAPALIASLRGPEHVVELANEGFRAIFGGRELVGKTYREAIPEFESQPFFDRLDTVYRTGQTYHGIEEPVILDRTNSGQLEHTYITYTYQATRDAQGQIDGILVFCYEVTEQVLARQERETQQQQLRDVFEQAPVAIFVLRGLEYIFEVVNPSMAELIGSPPEQILGQRYFELFPALVAQGYPELVAQVWHSGQAYVAQEQAAQLPRHGEGGMGYYNFTYVPLRDAQETTTGIMCVAVDVTPQVLVRQQVQRLNQELAATNEELNKSNTQLTRTNVDLDTFVYTASHDLKAPITNIESITLTLRDTLPPAVQQDEMIAHLLDLLEQTTTRFKVTIDQLTDLSKLQLAHAGPAESVNLAAAVESVRLDLAPVIAAANAHLTVEVAPDLFVSFSPANLRSAIYNLLSNAVKYRALDRPAQVRLRAFPAESRVVLEVEDNGLGMSAVQQRQLFGLFQRLHTHVEGTGVGLYITKRLVENGGGTIAVASQVDVGTTFTLTFPA